MKKFFILFLALICVSSVQAQSPSRNWQVGVNFTALQGYRTLRNTNDTTTANQFALGRSGEIPKLGYSLGILGGRKISTHLNIETGFQYTCQGYRTEKHELVFGDNIDPRQGFTPSGIFAFFRYNFYSYDIPVKLRYTSGSGKYLFTGSAGIVANLGTYEIITSVLQDDNGTTRRRRNSYYPYRPFNIAPTVSAGITYKPWKRVSLIGEGILAHQVLSIINAPTTAYLWSAGLNFGCYYSL